MPLLIFLFWLIVGILLWKSENRATKNRVDEYQKNRENGEFEYILAWNIFQDLTQEIYKEGAEYFRTKHQIVGIYDREFGEVGLYLYGQYPEIEAIHRAQKLMATMGKKMYTSQWYWDERRRCLSEITIKAQNRTPIIAEDFFKHPNIVWDSTVKTKHVVCNGRLYAAPTDGAYSRHLYVCSDGVTLKDRFRDFAYVAAKSKHYLTERDKEIANFYGTEVNGYKAFLQQQKQLHSS